LLRTRAQSLHRSEHVLFLREEGVAELLSFGFAATF
jgi:hypothetical protein